VSRTPRFRPTGAVVAAGAVLGAIALGGCGAGQIAQTSTQVSAVAGANGGVGAMVVRDAYIEFGERVQGANVYPRGGAAPLKMTIVNTGLQPDRLVSASSPAAASVEIVGESEIPPGRVLLIEGEPAAPAGAPAGAGEPGASAAPAEPGAAQPEPARPSGEPVVPGDEVGGSGQQGQAAAVDPSSAPTTSPRAGTGGAEVGAGEGQLVLSGLTEDVRAGLTYPLVLNFERAGQVTLDVPVGNPSEPREDEPVE
jgi:copper(I)-binding protein